MPDSVGYSPWGPPLDVLGSTVGCVRVDENPTLGVRHPDPWGPGTPDTHRRSHPLLGEAVTVRGDCTRDPNMSLDEVD